MFVYRKLGQDLGVQLDNLDCLLQVKVKALLQTLKHGAPAISFVRKGYVYKKEVHLSTLFVYTIAFEEKGAQTTYCNTSKRTSLMLPKPTNHHSLA